eukprot:Seg2501.3 transcript_id=Seg2501.3/GoldUCD/mRNA.D3Y31 product="Immunoglobulin-binding protein 1" protein_id=Seg2501.3/GoldUCD/D3Y31
MAAKNESLHESKESELKETFDKGWKVFKEIEGSEAATNSKETQDKIRTSIKHFSDSTNMVNLLGLFSSNEELEEVTSSNLRYFLLPAFMGELTLQQTNEDRQSDVARSKVYFIDFLERCKNYAITDLDVTQYNEKEEKPSRNIQQNITSDRQSKIARYKETKELKDKIEKLEERLKHSPDSVEDEIQREYYLSWIRFWINESIEKLSLIKSELEILEHMKNMKLGKVKPEEKPKPREPMKPILITKETLKSKVFGAGYPSLPTMTPEQWMDNQIAEGKVVLDYSPNVNSVPQEKDSEDEEDESEEKLQKDRAWDDWKDEHRRGEGNRKDRG